MQFIRVLKKFNCLLSRKQKRGMIRLVVLMIVGGFLEMTSVSLVLPFMNVVMSPEEYMQKDYVVTICTLLNISSASTFLIVLSLLLAFLYLVKNLYLLFEYNMQYKYVYSNMLEMQNRLLDSFIRRPYEYYLQANSGEIIRVVNTDTPAVFDMLVQILFFFTEIFVSGMLVIAVFVMAPLVTLMMAAVLLVMTLAINHIVRPILTKAGKSTITSVAGVNKWLLQSIQGIKELKVMSKEDFFEKNFHRYGKEYVAALRKKNITSVIPRLSIEGISMSAMFVIIGFMIFGGVSLNSLVPMVSAIAVAAIRLLPSVNRITIGLANIAYGEPMLDKLMENLRDIESNKDFYETHSMEITTESKISDFSNEILLDHITYQYPEAEEPVLLDTSLRIKKGESIGLVGASGAGKSTTVDVMLGFLNLRSGKVLIDGRDISKDMPGFLGLVGYIPQSIFILDDTIRANVAFGEENISEENVWKAIKEASLYDFVKTLPEGLDTQIGERGVRLSGGQRQRIGIARALYHNPSILVLDEATSALDNETEKSIMESIDNLRGQKTMIIIAHRLTTIENCDCVYRVENGKISLKYKD